MELDGTSNGLISIETVGTKGNYEKASFRIAIALAKIHMSKGNVTCYPLATCLLAT